MENTKIIKSSLEEKKGTISVLILTQNSEKTIERALKSVSSFDEVLVVDGGSSDNTECLVKVSLIRFVKILFRVF